MSLTTAATSSTVPPGVNFIETNVKVIDGISVPLEFFDPVNFELMTNPMIIFPSGNTFDSSTIENITKMDKLPQDPISKQTISMTVENRALKESIERFHALHPSLKRLIEKQPDASEPTKSSVEKVANDVSSYTEDQFMSLFKDRDRVSFPAGKKITIYNVSRSLLLNCLKEINNYNVLRILDNVLLPSSKHLDQISIKASTSINVKEGSITLKFDQDLSLVLEKTHLRTTLKDFCERFSRSNITHFKLYPNQKISFLLSNEEREILFQDSLSPIQLEHVQIIMDLSSCYLPHRYLSFAFVSDSLYLAREKINEITFSSNKELSFKLLKRK